MTTGAPLDLLVRQLRKAVGKEADAALLDGELLKRFTDSRDEDAFAILVQRHGPMVLTVCRSILRSWHDAEDAFQATFLVLARKAASIRQAESLASWLYGVAYHVAVRARAKTVRRRAREPRLEQMPSSDPLLDMTGRELQQILHEELHKLPDKYRSPLVLCYLQGKTQEEAARQLHWTKATVRGRLDRGRAQLRRRLAGRGLGATAVTALLAQSAQAAVVPLPLVHTTVQSARLVAAGRAAGVLSSSVASLMNDALKATFLARVPTMAVLCLALALLGASMGALAAAWPARGPQAKPVPPAAKLPEQPRLATGKEQRVDRHGDPLPEGALQRLGTIRMRHGRFLYGAIFSPEGRLISIGPATSDHASVIAWDPGTGKGTTLGKFPHFCERVTLVAAASSASKVFAIVVPQGGLPIFIRDTATGKEQRRIPSPEFSIGCMTLSRDARTLATGGVEGVIRLYEVATGKAIGRIRAHAQGKYSSVITGLAFSPDARLLASADIDGMIRFWDTATGKEMTRAEPAGAQGSLAFSPDGKLLVYGGKDRLVYWDLAAHKPNLSRRLPGRVTCLAFSSNGSRLISGSNDGTLAVCDVATGRILRRWSAHGHPVEMLGFARDGKTFVSGTCMEGAVRLWNLASGKEVLPLAGHRGQASPVHYSANGQHLVTRSRDNTIRRWDLATGQDHVVFQRPSRTFSDRAYLSPDCRTFVTADELDKTVRQYDAATGKEVRMLGKYSHPGGHSWLTHAFDPASKVLAVRGEDRSIVLWSLETGCEVRRLKGHEDELVCLQFSPDGKILASAAADGWKALRGASVRLWDVTTGKELRHLDDPHHVGLLLFSPDGRQLATGGHGWRDQVDQGVRIWEIASGRKVCQIGGANPQRRLPGPRDVSLPALTPLAWSPDGRLLAVASLTYEQGNEINSVVVYETATGQATRRFPGDHNNFAGDSTTFIGAVFSPNGRTLATGCWDSSVLTWDLTGRVQNGRLQGSDLPAAALQRCWTALAGARADQAYAAIWRLAAAPVTTLHFLNEHLRPAADPDFKRIGRLVADLDNKRFAVRKQATRELEMLDRAAAPALRKVLAGQPSPELRLRLRSVLDKLETKPVAPAELRRLRAITVLEQIGTPDAVRLLQKLATGAAAAPSTAAARSTLGRLRR
jgi:RNA polymerase sigma factor (sigma-70 family)